MAAQSPRDLQLQYDFLYEVVSKKLEEQINLLSNIDTKASIFLAVIGAIIGGTFLLLTADKLGFKEYKYLVCLELISFVISGFFIFKAFLLNKKEVWNSPPNPKKLIDAFAQKSFNSVYYMKLEIIKNINMAYENNASLIQKKYNNFDLAQWFFYSGIIILVLHLCLLSFGVNKIIIPLK